MPPPPPIASAVNFAKQPINLTGNISNQFTKSNTNVKKPFNQFGTLNHKPTELNNFQSKKQSHKENNYNENHRNQNRNSYSDYIKENMAKNVEQMQQSNWPAGMQTHSQMSHTQEVNYNQHQQNYIKKISQYSSSSEVNLSNMPTQTAPFMPLGNIINSNQKVVNQIKSSRV